MDFGMKGPISLSSFGRVDLGPQNEEEAFVKGGRKYLFMAKGPSHLLSMVSIPGEPRDPFTNFLKKGIIDKKKEELVGFNMQGLEEVIEFDLRDFFLGSDTLFQETGEAAGVALQQEVVQRLGEKRGEAEVLSQGEGGMSLFS